MKAIDPADAGARWRNFDTSLKEVATALKTDPTRVLERLKNDPSALARDVEVGVEYKMRLRFFEAAMSLENLAKDLGTTFNELLVNLPRALGGSLVEKGRLEDRPKPGADGPPRLEVQARPAEFGK